MTFGVFGSCGELFLKQGRPDFYLRGCAILCITTYRLIGTGQVLRIKTVKRSFPQPFALGHAEDLALNEVNLIEKKHNWKAVKVELFSSYSPCMKCCKLIEQFLCLRPQCKISIAFTCVYRDNHQQHRSALSSLLKNASVIRLDVFREEDWKVLQDMELVTLTPEQYSQMRDWDEYWRYKLDNILGWCRVVEALSLQCAGMASGSQQELCEKQSRELRTDGVQAFQKSISAYKKAGFPSQAKLEEMDKKVREAMRKRNRENWLLFVALVCVLLFALWFLITKFIF